jgi:tetratricopeptide (TPR) repeat protein
MKHARHAIADFFTAKIFTARVLLASALSVSMVLLSACEPEQIRKNEEVLRQQETEIEQLRRENAAFRSEREKGEQKTQACNRAYGSFEKGQAAKEPREAVALYRDGLKLCPDDDVAHYELGKILAGMGRRDEARDEFEAALKINPNFKGARLEMEKLKR